MVVDVTGDGPQLIVDNNETYIRIWLVTFGGSRWRALWLYRTAPIESHLISGGDHVQA